MSLQLLAKQMESKGRKGDSMLVHMTPGEVSGLQKLAESAGGSLSVNPETGLVEANFLKSMLPTIVGLAVGVGTGNPMLGAAAGAAVGGVQARRSDQDVGLGMVMGGLGGYGGASMGAGFSAAGAPVAAGVTPVAAGPAVIPGATASQAITPAMQQAAASQGLQISGAEAALMNTRALPTSTMVSTAAPVAAPTVVPTGIASTAPAPMGFFDKAKAGFQGMGTEEGRARALKAMGGSEGALRALMAAGTPYLNQAPTYDKTPGPYPLLSTDLNRTGGGGTSQNIRAYEPAMPRYTAQKGNVYIPTFSAAEGGEVGFFTGGGTGQGGGLLGSLVANRPFIIDPATGNVIPNPNIQRPAPKTFADMGIAGGMGGDGVGYTPNPDFDTPSQKAAYYAERPNQAAVVNAVQKGFGYTPFGMLQERMDPDFVDRERSVFTGAQSGGSRAPGYVGLPADMRGVNLGPPGARLAAAKDYEENQRQLNEAMAAAVRANIGMTTVGGGIGMPSIQGTALEAPSSGLRDPQQMAQMAAEAAASQQRDDDSMDIGSEGRDVGYSESATSQQAGEKLASGGLMGLAKGGMRSGGFVIPADVVSMVGEGNTDAGYKRIKSMVPGATAIKGKDGGQSDTVKTSIEGKQRARVAHGEMYIPPETVKRLGGAKKLYAMMDRVRQQATGSKKQIKPVSLKRAMA
jgi:hypothetical protein